MLRQVSRSLLGRASAASMRWRRQFPTDLPADTAGDSKFIESWKKTNPNMDPLKTPMSYMAPRPPTPATIPVKLTVNLVFPYDLVLSSKENYGAFLEKDDAGFRGQIKLTGFKNGDLVMTESKWTYQAI